MTRHKRIACGVGLVLAGLITLSVTVLVRQTFLRPNSITAYFTAAIAIYPGDEVRISGVKVGNVASIQSAGTKAKLTIKVDRHVPIPADARAVIVASNLVAARYVQLTPAYRSSGPKMHDGAVIPAERTAVPVEWDDVKTQLMKLATDLGPGSDLSSTSMGRFIDSAANALGGNGEKLRQTLAHLSGAARILGDNSSNIVAVIKNLQVFVTALRDSGQQIVEFQDRLATLTSVLNDNSSDLDAALTNLSSAVGEVKRFIEGSRDKTSEQIQRLANVTQNLVDHRIDLENILHVAPNAFANGYNIYNPDTGAPRGVFVINNFSNLVQFICSGIGAVENVTAAESAKLCAQYLGPALRLPNFNYLPFPYNIALAKQASPDNLIYSEANLAPGGAGPSPGPAEIPPAVSAYTGIGEPKSLPDMLLPAEQPLPDAQSAPQPPGGTPSP